MSKLFAGMIMSVVLYTNMFAVSTVNQELTDFFALFENSHFQIDEWKVYRKGNAGIVNSLEEFHDFIRELEKNVPIKDWQIEEVENHHYKVTGGLERDGVRMNLAILGIYQNGKISISVNQDIRGTSKKDYEINSWLTLNGVQISKNFYTVTASKKARYGHEQIKSLTNKVMERFSAKKLEGLEEEQFMSVSAYLKRIKNDLTMGKKRKMNMQIAVRSSQDKTTLTVGTPIIITEY